MFAINFLKNSDFIVVSFVKTTAMQFKKTSEEKKADTECSGWNSDPCWWEEEEKSFLKCYQIGLYYQVTRNSDIMQ